MGEESITVGLERLVVRQTNTDGTSVQYNKMEAYIIKLIVCLVAYQFHWAIALAFLCLFGYYALHQDPSHPTLAIFFADDTVRRKLGLAYHESGYKVFAGCPDPEQLSVPFPPEISPIQMEPRSVESAKDAMERISGHLGNLGRGVLVTVTYVSPGFFYLSHYKSFRRMLKRMLEENFLGITNITKVLLYLIPHSTGCIIYLLHFDGEERSHETRKCYFRSTTWEVYTKPTMNKVKIEFMCVFSRKEYV